MTAASIAQKRVQAQPNLTIASMSATASTQRSLYPSDRAYTDGATRGGHRAVTFSDRCLTACSGQR